MIKPSIGRVVWYNPRGLERLHRSEQPLAAIVTYVLSDTRINLAVFDANGVAHPRCSVLLYQDGADAPMLGQSYAEWMPYQKGQAAKTEELEKKLPA